MQLKGKVRRAFIGDIHGCHEEFQIMLDRLAWLSLDEICLSGDLVDRGPNSGLVVQIAMDNNLKSVMGNHEDKIIKLADRVMKYDPTKDPKNDAERTLSTMTPERIEYMRGFSRLRVFDDQNIVSVHGGLWPLLELHQQPHNVIRAQMILPYVPDEVRWWGPEATKHKSGNTEEMNFNEGYRRWYQVYDGPWTVVYGHSVFAQPFIYKNEGAGPTVGIDTGNVFGGVLTAAVFCDDDPTPFFVSIPPKRVYCKDKLNMFLER